MNKTLQPSWVVSGIIEAPVEQVWEAFFESTPLVSASDKQTVARESGPVRLAGYVGAYSGGISSKAHTEIDKQHRFIAVQGGWWYRGVHSIEPHERGSLISYRVYNLEQGPARWLIPWMNPKLGEQMKQGMLDTLHQISEKLHCKVYPITED